MLEAKKAGVDYTLARDSRELQLKEMKVGDKINYTLARDSRELQHL